MYKIKIIILTNFRIKINKRNVVDTAKLVFQIQKTDICAQKINNFFLKTYNKFIIFF